MEEKKLLYFISKKLVLDTSASVINNAQTNLRNFSFMVDAIVKNGKETIYVDIKRRISLENLFRFNACKDLVELEGNDGTKFVILSVFVRDDIQDLARKLGITIIKLPPSSLTEAVYTSQKYAPSKLTSKKAFEVIYKMLAIGPSTIMRLSAETGVSYGWAHGIVARLTEIGIVERKYGLYEIVNLDKLLDSIAYERPIISITSREYWTDSDDILKFARKVSTTSKIMKINVAFMGPTASILYDPYYVRSDTAYIYVEPHQISNVVNELHLGSSGNLKVLAYLPDRDVFTDSETLDGVTVTSKRQVLLDLASFGILYRESIKRLVKRIATE